MPDCTALMDLARHQIAVFIPRADTFYKLWVGVPLTPAEVAQKYGLDLVYAFIMAPL